MATKPTILIVDDSVGTIRALAGILREIGESVFATDGEKALAMVRESPPDLVLLDAEMPGMDGFAVCRAIKAEHDFADLPILFVTSHSGMDKEVEALSAGAVDFISKPPNPPVVRARVKTHLELKQRTDALRQQISIDGLTGVANRLAFDKALDMEWRRSCRSQSPLSLLMIDVDYFKRYNDHYGHLAGDDCLRTVARALTTCAKRPGEVVARYGGEEFAVILPGCDATTASRVAENVLAAVAEAGMAHAASDVAGHVTVSVGVATSDARQCGFDDAAWSRECQRTQACHEQETLLVGAADAALYAAKSGGRNRYAVKPVSPPAEGGPA
jgi:diguanylate cyclase (GGDEF)-like protein